MTDKKMRMKTGNNWNEIDIKNNHMSQILIKLTQAVLSLLI